MSHLIQSVCNTRSKMSLGYIYCIENIITNKFYIGQTQENNPNSRWADHKSALRSGKGNTHLRNSYNKYGQNSFTFTILEEVLLPEITVINRNEHLTIYEDAWIQFFKQCSLELYNVRIAASSNKGMKHSQEAKKKMSDKLCERIAPNKNIPMSEEQKLKLSKNKKGKPCSSKTKFKLGQIPWNKGKEFPDNSGESCILSKLTEKQVKDIRELLASGVSCVKVSNLYNINRNTVYRIRDRKSWAYI